MATSVEPGSTASSNEPGRSEVARHLELLRQAGFVEPRSLHYFEVEVDGPPAA